MYLNMVEDGTWEQGISETSQIIALATKIGQLENEIKKNKAAHESVTKDIAIEIEGIAV